MKHMVQGKILCINGFSARAIIKKKGSIYNTPVVCIEIPFLKLMTSKEERDKIAGSNLIIEVKP